MTRIKTASFICLIGLTALAAGCSSSGTDRSKQAAVGMQETQKRMTALGSEVDQAVAAMRELQTSKDLRASFKKYSAEVDHINERATAVRRQSDDMHARGDEYVKKWQAEMARTSNPELKQIAEQRRAAVQQKYGGIKAAYAKARDEYRAFYGDLTAIRTYLSNDLTPGGVAAAKPVFDRAEKSAADLHQTGASIRAMLAEVAGGIAPGGSVK